MAKRLPKATSSTLEEIHRESAEPPGAADRHIAEPTTNTFAVPGSNTAVRAPDDSALRRAQAVNIVERYTTYSALGGCIPLAIVDSISVGLIIFNMVRALAEHYQVPFQQNQVKACIAALAGGIVSPSVGSATVQLLARLVPGAWIIGTAASSATAAACTRYMGRAFVAHFASGGTALDFDIARLRGLFKREAAA